MIRPTFQQLNVSFSILATNVCTASWIFGTLSPKWHPLQSVVSGESPVSPFLPSLSSTGGHCQGRGGRMFGHRNFTYESDHHGKPVSLDWTCSIGWVTRSKNRSSTVNFSKESETAMASSSDTRTAWKPSSTSATYKRYSGVCCKRHELTAVDPPFWSGKLCEGSRGSLVLMEKWQKRKNPIFNVDSSFVCNRMPENHSTSRRFSPSLWTH